MHVKKHLPGAIGIFDSGVGGLTVLKEIKKKLPREHIVYLGDTARVPYGIRSAETVIKYSLSNTEFLLKQNIKLLVIACNTASAVANSFLRERYTVPVVDVVEPGARRAVKATGNGRVGIIGTMSTIASSAYQKAIKQLDPAIETFTRACPLFVPLAEEGWCSKDDEVVQLIARRYLEPLKEHGIDTLVLGCTHYPLLKAPLQEVLGDSITLIDSAEETAGVVAEQLSAEGLENMTGEPGEDLYYLTDIPQRFVDIGRLFLGQELSNVHIIDI
ncbi:MAG: glutamate racemase [Deltaproteobacteria bacterium]|nr:glutamate racemase [Deltaproteobacteria bacterium]